MGTWDKIRDAGFTTGIWESGSRSGNKFPIRNGHQVRSWDFTKHHSRKFGKGFWASINRMPETEYKAIILRLIKRKESSRGRGSGLTEKQWKLLGLLMTKADPACLGNPRIKLPPKTPRKIDRSKVILRKKITSD